MRNYTCAGTPPQEPWALGKDTTAIVRGNFKLRYRLLPYFYTLMWRVHKAETCCWPYDGQAHPVTVTGR